jgi:hypothetical protein
LGAVQVPRAPCLTQTPRSLALVVQPGALPAHRHVIERSGTVATVSSRTVTLCVCVCVREREIERGEGGASTHASDAKQYCIPFPHHLTSCTNLQKGEDNQRTTYRTPSLRAFRTAIEHRRPMDSLDACTFCAARWRQTRRSGVVGKLEKVRGTSTVYVRYYMYCMSLTFRSD